MSTSSILEFPLLTEAQSQKATATNFALQAMESALAAKYDLVTTTATVAGFDLYIPYDNGGDLTDRTALRFMFLEALAGATQDFDIWHPDNPHLFVLKNSTTRVVTMKCYDSETLLTTGGSTVTVAAGAQVFIYCDGTNMLKPQFQLDNITQANDMHVSFYGQPDTLQIIGRFPIARDTFFPANFAGSRGWTDINPLLAYTMEVFEDATKIGEVAISTGGVYTFTTVSGTAKTVTAGSILTIVGNVTPDTLLENFDFVLVATVVIPQPVL